MPLSHPTREAGRGRRQRRTVMAHGASQSGPYRWIELALRLKTAVLGVYGPGGWPCPGIVVGIEARENVGLLWLATHEDVANQRPVLPKPLWPRLEVGKLAEMTRSRSATTGTTRSCAIRSPRWTVYGAGNVR